MHKARLARLLAGTALALFVSGCQSVQAEKAPDYAMYDPAYDAAPTYNPYAYAEDLEPAAGPAAQAPRQLAQARPPQAPLAVAPVSEQRSGALESEIIRLQERLQRVERAMLRLDRRMQLVERNELNRMSGGEAEGQLSLNADQEQGALAQMNLGPRAPSGTRYAEGFQPVGNAITSPLQAAPRGTTETPAETGTRRLPSLADGPAGVKQPQAELAIWTVRFEDEKIWPDRTQLPASREVVNLLRNNASITLFARGNKPNSLAFRDRVKALSRYLSKVTSLESVPIAAMPATHLDANTIEILAAP